MFRGLLISGFFISLVGCQTIPYQGQARSVSLKPQKEGVISIPTNYRDEDHLKAEAMMAKNCKPYQPRILEEGEVAVGTKVDSTGNETKREDTQHKVGSLFGIPVMSGQAGGKNMEASSTTTQIKEWHISYKCDTKNRASLQ